MKEDARSLALTILCRLEKRNKTLDLIVDQVLETEGELSRRDTALTSALVYGVVRWRGRLDWIIGHFSQTPLPRINPVVMNILRLGVFQLLHLDRIPDSAAVNTSVELAKANTKPHLANFVNGILRAVARGHEEVPFPSKRKDPVYALSKRKSMPVWLLARWMKRHGHDGAAALCDRINAIPAITLRANTLKTDREALMAALAPLAAKVAPLPHSPAAVALEAPEKRIPELPPFQEGWFQVQDEAAQLVAYHLAPKPGETVLDACAGLGGKTGHLAQLMENRGAITALDHDGRKLDKLSLEMKRLGVDIVSTAVHDLEERLPGDKFGPFDRILLDAPCSGLGVLQRNPDSKWAVQKKNLERYRSRQLRFMERMAKRLKPGGTLVYAVCSTEPEENERVVEAFLSKFENFAVDICPKEMPEGAASLMDEKGYVRTFPHLHDMDGFFSVRLRKKG